jgi:hypothetical protein
MVHESTTKVGSVIVALALLGMVGLSVAPPAQAEEPSDGETHSTGKCVEIYTDPPGAHVDPANCRPANLTRAAEESLPP